MGKRSTWTSKDDDQLRALAASGENSVAIACATKSHCSWCSPAGNGLGHQVGRFKERARAEGEIVAQRPPHLPYSLVAKDERYLWTTVGKTPPRGERNGRADVGKGLDRTGFKWHGRSRVSHHSGRESRAKGKDPVRKIIVCGGLSRLADQSKLSPL